MWRFKSYLILINFKTLIVTGLSIASTLACRSFGITAEFPLTLIAIAVVFPIVFSIGGAYKRREAALDDYAAIKANGRAIYFAFRDWPESNDAAMLARAREMLGEVLNNCRTLFMQPVESMEENEKKVYATFSELSELIQTLRKLNLASGEVSRCNQYLSKMMVAFESVKHVYQYRTPVSLRSYSDFFIVAADYLRAVLRQRCYGYESGDRSCLACLVQCHPGELGQHSVASGEPIRPNW